MKGKALAIANNDIVYLWWTYPEKIPGCLGFSVRRLQEGKAPVALPATVGFDPPKTDDPEAKHRSTTDYWPVQAYQWKDLFLPRDTEVRYEIVPMTGTPGKKLQEIAGLAIRTKPTIATEQLGRHRVVFNRGIISTQALAASLPAGPSGTPSKEALRKHIEKPGDKIRMRLAGEAVGELTALLARAAKEGGTCYCALYELTDTELIEAIKAAKGHVQLLLSNADSSVKVDGKTKKVYDGTNQATRKALRKVLGDDLHDRLLPKGNYIGHNKFVVYVNANGKAAAVQLGSTNWTPTGLCAQSNNIVVIDDAKVAGRYLEYWNRLLADDATQGPELREADAEAPPDLSLGAKQGTARVWFSPNTKRKSKPAKDPAPPPDMAEVFAAISAAEKGVLFLLFSAGAPSVLQHLQEVSRQRAAAQREFFVRGAISDAKTAKQAATRVYNDSALKAPNVLITGVAGVEDRYSYWERELAQLGYAVIHDKVVVIDPFTPACTVVVGSHNLGFKASYSNDENLCIIRGNRAIAEAFAAHVLDVVNHYNWRYRLQQNRGSAEGFKKAFSDLEDDERWQDKYFRGNFLASRDAFFF